MFLMGNVALKFFLNKTIDFIVPSYSWCCGLFAQQLFINIKILKKFSVLAWGYFRVCMYIWLKKILYACYIIMHNFTLYITRCKNYSNFFSHLSHWLTWFMVKMLLTVLLLINCYKKLWQKWIDYQSKFIHIQILSFQLTYPFVTVRSVMQHVRWLNNSMGFIVSYTRVAM